MITIFTPTYNRSHLLNRLKKCLDDQSDKNFEWVIVDDGSSDNTEEIVRKWFDNEITYSITYLRQSNHGKHSAFNNGVKKAKADWFICVDSDDTLLCDAVKTMNSDVEKLSDQDIGLVYPQKLSGFNTSAWVSIDGKYVDIIDLKEQYGIRESAILMRKELLVKYPFPVRSSERFIPEGRLYQKLIKEGKFKVHNYAFYISEYLDDGLTKNVWQLWAKNSEGVLEVLKDKYFVLDKYPIKIRTISKIKCIINFNTICMASGRNIIQKSPSKIMSLVLYLPSVYYYYKRFNG